MTKFVVLALIWSIPVFAANCGKDLSSKLQPSALPFLQQRIWSLEAEGKNDQADYLRRKLEIQIKLNKRNRLEAKIGRHQLYRATDVSFTLFREGEGGFKEHIAYQLNESLGRPVKIPVTASQMDGSLQLWMFYDYKDEMLSEEQDLVLQRALAADGDLLLFNFLMANTDQHEHNVIMDRDHGLVVFDFGAGLRYSTRNFIYYATPRSERKFEMEDIDLEYVAKILNASLKKAKLDWRSALSRLDREGIAAEIRRRVGPIEAREFESRVCLLRALVNGLNPARCNAL